MHHAVIDAADAVGLTEYFLERLDILADHDLAKFLFADCSPYHLDDLRADATRLINRLQTAQLTP
jgi:hypothetical protein